MKNLITAALLFSMAATAIAQTPVKQPVKPVKKATVSTTTRGGFGGGGSTAKPATKPVTKPATNVVKPATNTTKPASSGGSSGGGKGLLDDVVNVVTDVTKGGSFTEAEAAKAIRDALMNGITSGVQKVSVKDGYYGNALIKIPFPKEAQVVASTLNTIGMGSLVDNMVVQLNRAAEESATQATPIFLNSISQLTISDAVNIVGNQQPDAATQFLQRTTTEQLVAAFRPKVKSVLDKTLTTQAWSQVMGTYNQIPMVQQINPDLTDYVTRKALDGLFYMVAQEEAKIRKDPVARTTDILKKVFGGTASAAPSNSNQNNNSNHSTPSKDKL